MSAHDIGCVVVTEPGPGQQPVVVAGPVVAEDVAAAEAARLDAAAAAHGDPLTRHAVAHVLADVPPLYAATVAALADIRPPSADGEATLPGFDRGPLDALLALAGRHRAAEPAVLPPGMAAAVRDGVLSGDLPWHPDRANADMVRQYVHTGPGGGDAA